MILKNVPHTETEIAILRKECEGSIPPGKITKKVENNNRNINGKIAGPSCNLPIIT